MTKPFAIADRVAATPVAAPVPTSARQDAPPPAAGPSARDLSEIIGRVYDASLDPALWPGTLSDLSGFVGGFGASLLSKDSSTAAASLHFHDGAMAPERIGLYFGTYARMDMYSLAHCMGEVGRPIVSSEVADPEEFLPSRFHQEWVAPQGLVDFVNVPLERSGTGTAMFGVFRRDEQGFADAEMRRRVELLGPHLRRATAVGRTMERERATAASLCDALDGLAAGVFLLDDEGRLAHANASGRAMLRDRSVVDLRGGRLAAREEAQARTFQDAARRAAEGSAAAADVALDGRGGEPHLAQVLPFGAEARRPSGSRHAAAAVFVRRAEIEAPSALPALARRFDLTPAELRVLVALAEVGGVPEVAESLGVAVSTVKTHVHRLLSKTGAARQADLVKLLAGYSVRLLR